MNYPGQYGYPQQQYPGGPPPRKSHAGVIVAVVAAVLVLTALGITGFVAPGFFLSDDEGPAAAGPVSEAAGTGGGGPAPEQLAQAIVAGFAAKDQNALTALTCTGADQNVVQLIAAVVHVQSAQLLESGPDDENYQAKITLVPVGASELLAVTTLAQRDGRWCWLYASLSGPMPTGGSPVSVPPPSN